jgi:hypothetical protein
MISYKCKCGFEKEVSDDSGGKSVRCPKCKTVGIVPQLQFAKISTNPEDYADDPAYRPAEGTKAADRPGRTETDDTAGGNDLLLVVLFFLKIAAGLGVAATIMATIFNKDNELLAGVFFASGLASSAWTYVGAEAVRLLVEIERNTRRNT